MRENYFLEQKSKAQSTVNSEQCCLDGLIPFLYVDFVSLTKLSLP